MAVKITAPLTREAARKLKAGDSCLISGVIYTARDAAHKRLCELAAQGKDLPLDVKDSVIYFVGPTPAKPGQVIGSAGNKIQVTDMAYDYSSGIMYAVGVDTSTYAGSCDRVCHVRYL